MRDAITQLAGVGEESTAEARDEPVNPRALASAQAAVRVASGWLVLGMLNVLCSNLFGEPPQDVTTRLLHHLVDLGRHLALAVAAAALVYCWGRFGPEKARWRPAGLAVLALGVGAWLLPADLEGMAERNYEALGIDVDVLLYVLVVAASVTLVLLAETVRAVWRRRWFWRLPLLPLAGVFYFASATLSPYDNMGLHAFASILIATSLGGVIPLRLVTTVYRGLRRRAVAATVSVCVLAWSGWAVAAPQRQSVLVDLSTWQTNLLAIELNVAWGQDRRVDARLLARAGPYFSSRKGLAPLPPSGSSRIPKNGVVVFLTIDSLRADVFENPEEARMLPNVQRLKKQGVYFSRARSPGSQTTVTLASLSRATYFSQQFWTKVDRSYWLTDDKSRHFASDLTAAGVHTAMIPAVSWMGPQRGLIRGFKQHEFEKSRDRWAGSKEITDRVLRTLGAHRDGPLFIYAHFLDTHHPYKHGGRGPIKKRYLRSLRYVDRQIGRIVREVNKLSMRGRTLFVISADHGEAFGEHGAQFHASTLYDVSLRIPLLFSGPGFKPRVVDELVSLIDVGPTLLDLHGLPIPGEFMGQSLVRLLEGRRPAYTRPIVAEGRLKQAMVFKDGFKVIRDLHRNTLELYDLRADPGELNNLVDKVNRDTEEHVLLLQHFFLTHTRTANGYKPPMRK